jgi:hypothetical protein
MKLNSATYVWGFTALFILVAGCISLGDNGSPGATLQGPSASLAAGSSQVVSQGLTDAQKTQAINIARNDPSSGKIFSQPGYAVTGVFPGGAGANNDVTVIVYIEGGDMTHPDGSIWTPDMYQVTVDITSNKVINTGHTQPKALPTPTPTRK